MRLAVYTVSLVLTLASPLSAWAQTSAPLVDAKGNVNYKALRAACQGAPPYAAKFSGAKIVGEASLTEAATKRLLTKLSAKLSSLPVPTDLDVTAQAVIAEERVGVTFSSAFGEVGTSYFCMLRTLYADDSAKQDALNAAEEFYSLRLLLTATSPALYNDPAEKTKQIKDLVSEVKALKVAFTAAEVRRALGDYKFDAVSKAQFDAVVKSPGLGQLSACGGVLKRSQADLDGRILNGLDNLDTSFPQMLSGTGSLTVAAIFGLGQQLYESGPAAPKLGANDMLCVKSAGVDIKDTIKAGVAEKDDAKGSPKTPEKTEDVPPKVIEPKPGAAI